VANRAAWLTAQNMVTPNALSDTILAANGLSRNNPADLQLLNSRIDSALAGQSGFNRLPYAGFPVTTTNGVAQSLRPYPQFNNNLAGRWAPLGNSWYDSLQMKATKRYSHGLDFSVGFTWAKELATNGANDVFNRANQKGLGSNSIPLSLVTGFNYEVPKFSQNRLIRAVFSEWTIGGVLRYQSGSLIEVAGSNNQLNNAIFQSTRFNRFLASRCSSRTSIATASTRTKIWSTTRRPGSTCLQDSGIHPRSTTTITARRAVPTSSSVWAAGSSSGKECPSKSAASSSTPSTVSNWQTRPARRTRRPRTTRRVSSRAASAVSIQPRPMAACRATARLSLASSGSGRWELVQEGWAG